MTLKVAIIGAGPAGIYAGNNLTTSAHAERLDVAVDLIERLLRSPDVVVLR